MSINNYERCLSFRPRRFLSEVAREASETLELVRDLPSRVDVYNKVESFLRLVKGINRPAILWIVGTWGLGKTAIYNGVIEPYARRNKDEYMAVSVIAGKVFDLIEYILDKFKLMFMSPEIFLAALIQAIRNEVSDFRDLPDLSRYNDIEQYLIDSLTFMKRKLNRRKLIIFIDEFEHIYDRYLQRPENTKESRIGSGVFEAIVELANVNINALKRTNTGSLIHLAISVSEDADAAIRQKTNFMIIAGRLERRFIEIRLKPMYRIEVFYHISALLKYMFNTDKIDFKTIANPPSLLNIFGYATGGLPGNTEHLLNQILSSLSSSTECPDGTRILDIDNAYTIFSLLESSYKGQKLNVFVRDNYIAIYKEIVNALVNAYFKKNYAEQFARAILLSLGGVSISYINYMIKNKFGTTIETDDIIDMITISNNRIREVYNIEKGIYLLKAFYVNSSIFDLIIRIKQLIEEHLEKLEEALSRIGVSFREYSPDTLFEEIFDKFFYVTSKGKLAILIPADDDNLVKYISDKLGVKTEIRSLARHIKSIIEKLVQEDYLIEDSSEDYIALSEDLIQKYVITPTISIVDFIVDLKDRYFYIAKARTIGWKTSNIAMPLAIPIIYNLKSFFTERPQDEIQVTPLLGNNDLQVYMITVKPSKLQKPFLRLLYVVLPEVLSEEHVESLRQIVLKEYLGQEPIAVMYIMLPRNPEVYKNSLDFYRYFIEELSTNYQIYIKEFHVSSTADVIRFNVFAEYIKDKLGINEIHNYINELVLDIVSFILGNNKEAISEKYRENGLDIYKLQQFFINDLNMRYFTDMKKDLIKGLISVGRYIPSPILSGRSLLLELEKNNQLVKIHNFDTDLVSKLREVELSYTISVLGYIFGNPQCFHEDGCKIIELLDFVKKNVMCFIPYGVRVKLIGRDIESSEELLRALVPLIGYGFINLVECNNNYDNCKIRINTKNPYVISLIKYILSVYNCVKCEQEHIYREEIFKNYYIYPLEYTEHILKLYREYMELLGILLINEKNKNIVYTFLNNPEGNPIFIENLYKPLKEVVYKLEQLEEEYLGKLCYMVSGKQRGYRAWTYDQLINNIKDFIVPYKNEILNLSRKELTNTNVILDDKIFTKYLICVSRLIYLNKFLSEIVLGTDVETFRHSNKAKYNRLSVFPLLEAARLDLSNLENTIENAKERLENAAKTLEENLNKYVIRGNTKIELDEYNELNQLRNEFDEVVNARYNTYEFLEEVRDLWLDTTNSDIDLNECVYGADLSGKARRPTRFPFYFRDKGRLYLFNYKTYKIHRLLREKYKDFIIIDEEQNPYESLAKQISQNKIILIPKRYNISEEIEKIIDRLARITKFISDIVEYINKLGREKEKFRQKLTSLSEEDKKILKQILEEDNLNTAIKILEKSVIEASKLQYLSADEGEIKLKKINEIEDLVIKWIKSQLEALNIEINIGMYESFDQLTYKIHKAIEGYVDESSKKMKELIQRIDDLINKFKKFNSIKTIIRDYREILKFIKELSNSTLSRQNLETIETKLEELENKVQQCDNDIKTYEKNLVIVETTILAEMISKLYDHIHTILTEIRKTLNDLNKLIREINAMIINELINYISTNYDTIAELYDIRKKICVSFQNKSRYIQETCNHILLLYNDLNVIKEKVIKGLNELKNFVEDRIEFVKLFRNLQKDLAVFSTRVGELNNLLSRGIVEIVKRESTKLGISDTTILVMEIIFDTMSKHKDKEINISDIVNEARSRGINDETEIYRSIHELEIHGIILTSVRVK